MMSVVDKVKQYVLYVDHDDNIVELSWDDTIANLVASLPKVLSPRKVKIIEKNHEEKLPVFYSNLKIVVGMLFESVQLLRKAITKYRLKERVEIKLSRNEKKRLRVHCANGCPWGLYASHDGRAKGLVVNTYCGKHNYQKHRVLKRCTSKWLADNNFARIVQKEWNMTPSRSKLARARRLSMKEVLGDEVDQYKLLWDYGHELRRSNHGSTFFLNLNGNRFSTMYMSLDACKRGFLSACRPIICLDGWHIKTKFGGQILTAVGIDPNDCIYPIAIGIVEALKDNLGIDNTYPWTIMTYKQKGLIQAIQQLFPDSEHRFYARYLYSNFQMHFKGENLKNQLWACARSSNIVQWNQDMDMMRELNPDAHKWLEEMPPQTWVRTFFSTYPKCDMLLNNTCEIKTQLITRHYNKEKEVGDVWQGPICSKIRKKLQKNIELANICYALPASKGVFEVRGKTNKYIVDISLKNCDCRRWDLTGIPCSHAISCLRHERIPQELVLPYCYSTISFLLAYEVFPRVYEKKVGRPPKSRRRQPYEIEGPNGLKLTKHGVIINCRYCGSSSHNRAGCPLRKQGQAPTQVPTQVPVEEYQASAQSESTHQVGETMDDDPFTSQ
uniref:SWIM-type domain-containing protein n=1 Tax=Setaria italica TaxID=4555 RepID=K3YY80_SETIT